MPIERVLLIHKIEDAILEPDTSAKDGSLTVKFDASLQSILDKPGLPVGVTPLTPPEIEQTKATLVDHFISVASDLKTFGLAQGHIHRLITFLTENGCSSEKDILKGGAEQFYDISRNVLGPLWTAYINQIFQKSDGKGSYLFAARDATPMYWAAEGILSPPNEHKYPVTDSSFVHVDWNRWFMGQEDETDDGRKPLPFDDPLMQMFYRQMGFGNEHSVKIVEPGAWGSAANALKTVMPDQEFELFFMFSHMPEYIYGFLNEAAPDIEERHFEMINDTAEAVPKSYVRPETLTLHGGKAMADLTGKVIESPFMKVWSWAVNQGAFDAGVDFAQGKKVDVKEHVEGMIELSKRSAQGEWTGVLPRNTLTWTEGERWREEWKWGKIPPLE